MIAASWRRLAPRRDTAPENHTHTFISPVIKTTFMIINAGYHPTLITATQHLPKTTHTFIISLIKTTLDYIKIPMTIPLLSQRTKQLPKTTRIAQLEERSV